MLVQKPRSGEIQHFAYLYLHIFHWKCWRKTQDYVVCICFHDLKCPGALEGSINLTVFPQTTITHELSPGFQHFSPLPRCQRMILLLNSLRERKRSEGVIYSPPSRGSNLPTGPRGFALTLIWQSICALRHVLTPQLKDVLLAIVSSLTCLNFSQSAEGGLLASSGHAPWLGCGSLPKKGGTSGPPLPSTSSPLSQEHSQLARFLLPRNSKIL